MNKHLNAVKILLKIIIIIFYKKGTKCNSMNSDFSVNKVGSNNWLSNVRMKTVYSVEFLVN